ncbi:hypothetical protein [Streptomyces sp. NRRL S-1022]|uniref:hypothetical protein n=1 Tax=Streptomyces sp. NRRL S-1022 TaxID=1463880 RepID=UPI0004C0B5C5|nr:hypothetical protein [Streptomyces sp. NRRL S-1022]
MNPSTTRRLVPTQSSRDYADHHRTVHADPRVTDLDEDARYIDHISHDNGRTWQPAGQPTVCGGHVQAEAASALLRGWDVTADGTTRTIRHGDGSLTRWTITT